MKDPSQRAKEIIAEREYITIATSGSDGQPWNSPVYSAFDENYVFYWGSHVDAQHSKNIAQNNKVFLVIYDSTVPAGEGEGVYVLATAEKITDPKEKDKAHKAIQDRRPSFYWRREEFDEPTPLSLYKAVPQKIWMNGEGTKDGHYIDIRVDVLLNQ
jgi:nitroimidazol reductase NimA-like FMN-containing flavoprotein (pyridoxamine 5'-phosphate oxidase superfamily)